MKHVFNKFLILSIITILLNACSSYSIFRTSQEDYKIIPGTLVVVAGSSSESDVRLAELLSEQITKETKFKVMSQSAVFKKIPQYPFDIVSDQYNEKNRNSTWMSKNMKNSLAKYQKILGTQYILLVWTDNLSITLTNNSLSSFGVNFMSRLVKYPSQSVIGYSAYRKYGPECYFLFCLPMFAGVNEKIDYTFKYVAKQVTNQIVENTSN